MSKTNFKFWQGWLILANGFTLLVGLIVAFAGNSLFLELHNHYSNLVFFEGRQMEPEILRYKNWLFGIIGGTIVGFHLLMIMIAIYPFKKKEKWAYWALWMGLLSWFVIDTSISIHYKAYHNVLLINLPAVILLGLPLLMTFRAIFRNPAQPTNKSPQ